jgi:hypothetical protein
MRKLGIDRDTTTWKIQGLMATNFTTKDLRQKRRSSACIFQVVVSAKVVVSTAFLLLTRWTISVETWHYMIKNCTLFSMKDIHMLSYRLIKCSLLFLKYTGAKVIQCQKVKCVCPQNKELSINVFTSNNCISLAVFDLKIISPVWVKVHSNTNNTMPSTATKLV